METGGIRQVFRALIEDDVLKCGSKLYIQSRSDPHAEQQEVGAAKGLYIISINSMSTKASQLISTGLPIPQNCRHTGPTIAPHAGKKAGKKYTAQIHEPDIKSPESFSNQVWNQMAVVSNIQKSNPTMVQTKYLLHSLIFASASDSQPPSSHFSSSVVS